MLAQGRNEGWRLGGPRRIGKPGLNFFMFNGHENFEKNKDVVSMGVPWTMARSILYFERLGTYLCFAGVMPFQNIHPVRSFIASTIVQCANFYPEYSIVGSCA